MLTISYSTINKQKLTQYLTKSKAPYVKQHTCSFIRRYFKSVLFPLVSVLAHSELLKAALWMVVYSKLGRQ